MVRIRHTRGRKAPSVEDFARSVVRFGASPQCDVVFYGESKQVTPSHAEIRDEGAGGWVLIDFGSPGGTSVGGQRVTRRVLTGGEVVRLGGEGGPEFVFELAAAASPVDDGKVDLATAQRIVREAAMRASQPDGRAAAIIARKVSEAERRASRRNLVLGIGVIAAMGCAAATAVTIWHANQQASQLVSEAGLGRPRDEPEPAPRASGDLPTRVFSGREIYEQNKTALYALGYTQGRIVGAFCTAFAVAPNLLATNAHCVISARRKGTASLIATQNDTSGRVRLRVLSTSYHPGYRSESHSADSPDVGFVRIEGTMPKVVTLAGDAELRALGAGDDVFLLGFPGRVMDPLSPSATFLQGHINRVVGIDGGSTSPDKSVLVQHDAATRGGNSGSPIFNQYGHVIAIHAAHLDEEEEQQLDGQKQTVVDSSPFRVGMRIDLLRGVQ